MTILSLQSSVVYGHVGNAAAVFALQRLGHDVWQLNTVRYSNHPGHHRFRGRKSSATELNDLVDGLADLGVLSRTRAVLSGYLGAPAIGGVLAGILARVAAAGSQAIFCCDPVMGDRDGGLYVPAELRQFFREVAVPRAHIVTPNHYELESLVDRPLPTLAHVLAAARDVRALGPALVVVTSVLGEGIEADEIATIAVGDTGSWMVATPRLPHPSKGAGDLLAALFLAHCLDGRGIAECLARAVSSVFSVIHATIAANADELMLIAAQDTLIRPTARFAAQRVA